MRIRVWKNGTVYFIDVHNNFALYEMKRFNLSNYHSKESLKSELAYQLRRIKDILETDEVTNDTDIIL